MRNKKKDLPKDKIMILKQKKNLKKNMNLFIQVKSKVIHLNYMKQISNNLHIKIT